MGGIPIPFFANASEGTSKDFWGGGIPIPYFNHASEGMSQFVSRNKPGTADENLDCLFLDLYVPAAAVKNPSLKLPVVSWFFGGAYIFGGKDAYGHIIPFYDGTGVIQESEGNVIFVTSNYRVDSLFPIKSVIFISDEYSARRLRLARRYNNGI